MTKQTTVLLVEDESKLVETLSLYLDVAGYQVIAIHDGNAVMDAVAQHQPNVILLDLMLPGRDGISLCREIRQHSNVPILILTARIEENERLLGLEIGADDYICKPYSPREVIARIKAVLRRHDLATEQNFHIAAKQPANTSPCHIDTRSHEAFYYDQKLELTPIEFRLYSLFVHEPKRIFTRDHLMRTIYTDHRVVTERTVDSHVKNLRKKMQLVQPEHDPIQAQYGTGYKFAPIVGS